MKKLFVILILMTLLGYESIGAEKAPILPRKANNAEYSLSEAKTFVLNYGTVSDWFRSNMLMIINRGLAASGETIKVDDSNMDWIFQHITYEFKDLGPYTNSRLSDGVPEFFLDKDGWSGNVAIFRYGSCAIILYKTQCMNLLDIPAVVVKSQPDPFVFKKPDIVDTVRATAGVTIINQIYNNNSIANSGNSNSVSSASVETPASGGTEYVLTDDRDNGFTRQTGWGYQQQQMMPIMPRQNVFHLGLNFQGGRRQNYTPPQQTPQRGYMGGGRSGSNQGYMGGNGNQGGGRSN